MMRSAASETVRVRPRPAIGVAACVAYVVLVIGLGAAFGVDYDEVSHSSENVLKGMIVPVALGGLVMAAIATRLGWWGPILRERPAAPRWALAIPVIAVIGIIAGLAATDWGAWQIETIALLLIGCLLVGFGEELATRGLLLVGMRARLTEGWIWFTTSALFALMHSSNLLAGQALDKTALQVVATFFLGSVFYAIRRVTGLLIVGMLIHGIGDFALLAEKGPGGDAAETVVQGSAVHRTAVLVSIVITLIALHRLTRSDEADPAAPSRSR